MRPNSKQIFGNALMVVITLVISNSGLNMECTEVAVDSLVSKALTGGELAVLWSKNRGAAFYNEVLCLFNERKELAGM